MLENKVDRRKFLKIGTGSALAGTAMLLIGCELELPAINDEKRTAILMDTSLCVECHACRVACQNHNGLPVDKAYIKFEGVEKGKFPKVEYHMSRHSCKHCTTAPCINVCPMKALYKGETGLTHMNFEACIGCGLCKMNCPFDIPVIDKGKMYKCTGCEDLITDGETPACVNTCIANALKYGTVQELVAEAKARVEKLKAQYPDANVYGVSEQGGLGLILVLRDKPSNFTLI